MREEKVMRTHMNERQNEEKNINIKPMMPESFNLELNNTCNHRCLYCPYHGKFGSLKQKPHAIEYDFARSILEQAAKLGIGRKEIGFYMTGEPFLYPKLVEIIKYAKELEFPYTYLTTNGVFATPERMIEIIDAGLDSIRFSINGSNPEEYEMFHGVNDYEIVKTNLKYMSDYIKEKRLNVATSISVVVTKVTPNIKTEMRSQFSDYVDDIIFIPVIMDNLDIPADLNEKYSLKKRSSRPRDSFVCPLPFNSMYVDSFGKVLPCCNTISEKVYCWDLTDELDLKKAWYSDVMTRYRKIFLGQASFEGTICENCIFRYELIDWNVQ